MGLAAEPPEPDDPALPLWRRVVWLAGMTLPLLLAALGVAYLLRALLG
jgi:hypothetical protein